MTRKPLYLLTLLTLATPAWCDPAAVSQSAGSSAAVAIEAPANADAGGAGNGAVPGAAGSANPGAVSAALSGSGAASSGAASGGAAASATATESAPAVHAGGVMGWASERTSALISTSLGLLGVRYHRGASDPAIGFDCSGFVRHVYLQAMGLMLPHNAYSMSLHGQSIGLNELRPGDLVFFNTLKKQFSHVGIYLGDNHFIHAPSSGKTVQVDNLDDSYWSHHFTGARRLDATAAGQTATTQTHH